MNNYHKTFSLVDCSAQIPNNFNVLDQSLIDDLKSGSLDPSQHIIAAGVNADSLVTFVTLAGDVVVFDPADNCIPPGDYVPTSNGTQVFLPNEEGRWPEGIPGFAVESQWLLSRSKSALEDTSLSIDNSYLNDADTAAETDDT